MTTTVITIYYSLNVFKYLFCCTIYYLRLSFMLEKYRRDYHFNVQKSIFKKRSWKFNTNIQSHWLRTELDCVKWLRCFIFFYRLFSRQLRVLKSRVRVIYCFRISKLLLVISNHLLLYCSVLGTAQFPDALLCNTKQRE